MGGVIPANYEERLSAWESERWLVRRMLLGYALLLLAGSLGLYFATWYGNYQPGFTMYLLCAILDVELIARLYMEWV